MIRSQPRRSTYFKPLWRRLLAHLLKLPPIENGVTVQKNVAIPMSDGLVLYADRFSPKTNDNHPTILIRSPWGRGWDSAPFSLLYRYVAQRFAERGYHVLLHDTHNRSRRGSNHAWSHVYEAQDGRDTLFWLAEQPWFNGELGMWGASYLGYSQLAAFAADTPTFKKVALFPVTTATNWFTVIHPDGAPALDTILRLQFLTGMPNGSIFTKIRYLSQQEKVIDQAANKLPIVEAAQELPASDSIDFAAAIEQNDGQSTFWQAVDLSASLAGINANICMVAGWYDIFVREQLADYEEVCKAGNQPRLIIGPWHHTDQSLGGYVLKESLAWFDEQLRGSSSTLSSKPVRAFVMGSQEWQEWDIWPPPTTSESMYLRAGLRLLTDAPNTGETPDCYIYNPADPTPTVGGAVINSSAGQQDNQELEMREDIRCYTSTEFESECTIVGEPQLVLYAKSSCNQTDFIARICDVHPDGRSINVTDGLVRLSLDNAGERETVEETEDGILKITIKLWPTAYSFARGHRLRLQVSSCAHPRWARNLGVGGSQLDRADMAIAEQTIFHDEIHHSVLELPCL